MRTSMLHGTKALSRSKILGQPKPSAKPVTQDTRSLPNHNLAPGQFESWTTGNEHGYQANDIDTTKYAPCSIVSRIDQECRGSEECESQDCSYSHADPGLQHFLAAQPSSVYNYSLEKALLCRTGDYVVRKDRVLIVLCQRQRGLLWSMTGRSLAW